MASQDYGTAEDGDVTTIQAKLAEAMDTPADCACESEPEGGGLHSGGGAEIATAAAAAAAATEDGGGGGGGGGGGEEEGGEGGAASILIVGKTGTGKSSLANTLSGQRLFAVGRGMLSTTRQANAATVWVLGKRLKVIDTPDISNVTSDISTAKDHVMQWKHMTQSAPDVVILTVRCDVRYTQEEHAIYRQIQQLWGDNSVLGQRLMVAFTFGDCQDEDLGEELQEVCEELKGVVREARGRYVQVNNKAREPEVTQHRQRICSVIDTVLKHNEEAVSAVPAESSPLAVVLVGRAGHGKSSLGNLITGGAHFAVQTGPSPLTTSPASHVICVRDTTLKVIDTPDVMLLTGGEKERQVGEWRKMAAPLPATLLLAVRCDLRYTCQDLASCKELLQAWEQGPPPRPRCRLIVAFTFTDRLDYDLEQGVKNCPQLQELLRLTEGGGGGGQAVMAVRCPASALLTPTDADRREQRRAQDDLLKLLQGEELVPSEEAAFSLKKIPAVVKDRVGRVVQFVKKSDAQHMERDITYSRDITVTCQLGTNQSEPPNSLCAIL